MPNNPDGQTIGAGIPGSSTTAMNGTIWPHAAVSSAPTPTAEHQLESSHSGLGELSGNFMDNLGLPTYGVEDINWENSLLMPVSNSAKIATYPDISLTVFFPGIRQFWSTGVEWRIRPHSIW